MDQPRSTCRNCGGQLPPKHHKYCSSCSRLASTLWKRQQRKQNRGSRYWLDEYLKAKSSLASAIEAYRDACRKRVQRWRARHRPAAISQTETAYKSNLWDITNVRSNRCPADSTMNINSPSARRRFSANLADDTSTTLNAFYSCFISYSTKDQKFAESLHANLQIEGIHCWFASENLKIGDNFRQHIDEAIGHYDKLLLVLSKTSVCSYWVELEVEAALERERTAGQPVIFPIRLDDAVLNANHAWVANIRRNRHIGNFSRWREQGFYHNALQRLLRDLQKPRVTIP